MRRFLATLAIALTAILAGCATTGPQYMDVESGFPALDLGKGRIFFYRAPGLGMALQPDIKLGDEVVGQSKPSSFFFVDRPAGRYVARARTEAEDTVDIELGEGEEVYVHLTMGLGFFVGRPYLAIRDQATALRELPTLAYSGSVPLVADSLRPGPPDGATTRTVAPRPLTGPVTLDDLKLLLPPAK